MLVRAAAVLALALSGVACERTPAPDAAAVGGANPPILAPEPTTAPAPTAPVLTAQGFGPLRIGMTRAEVEAAVGPDANPEAIGGPDPHSCDLFHPTRAPKGLMVMIESGSLTSVWLDPTATVKTDRGFGVGDAAAAVKQAYGAAAEASLHKYEDPPSEYVTTWATPQRAGAPARGIRYEIGRDGRVRRIAGGGSSIEYVEGCA